MMYITQIDGKWYAFQHKHGNIYSVGRDIPRGGRWTAWMTPEGVRYVATPSPTRNAAYMKAKRACEVYDDRYGGEVTVW